MPSPPIQVFLTTIASQPELRKRQEYILRILQTKKISFTSYDLACDEEAKRLWKRKAPLSADLNLEFVRKSHYIVDKQQLPGILVGGRYPGVCISLTTESAAEEAVEYGELDTFLRLNETWNTAADEDKPAPVVKPVGVPGAVPVSQMTPEHHKPKIFPKDLSTPLKPVNKHGDFDIGSELQGFGLQGVRVTDEELKKLVEDLGLGGDDATDMVKSLAGDTSSLKASGPSGTTSNAAGQKEDA
ncbi:hypothetical protein ID866_1170 [Astraeus odoratus]|nr:hypothetical protein ID866_1170 [Astraeus odoratus]